MPAAAPASAIDELRSARLLGTWKMASWTVEDLASGERRDALGPNPQGTITYTPDGRVVVLVLAEDRAKPASAVPTNEEKIALYDTMFAYAGTFSIDQAKVVHHLDMAWNGSWTGTHQIRFYKFAGDVLTYTSAPARSPMSGRDCVHTVVFRRLG